MPDYQRLTGPERFDRIRNAVVYPPGGDGAVLRFTFSDLATIERQMLADIPTATTDDGKPAEPPMWTDHVLTRLGKYDLGVIQMMMGLALKEGPDGIRPIKRAIDEFRSVQSIDLMAVDLRDAFFFAMYGKSFDEAFTAMLERQVQALQAQIDGEVLDDKNADPPTQALSANGSAEVPSDPV